MAGAPVNSAAFGKTSGWEATVVLFVLALTVLATRIIWFGNPVADYDEQLYSLIGNQLANGHLPYVDYWDRKPFGLFAIFAFAHAIGGTEPISFQILASIFALGGGWIVYRIALRLADRITALGSAVLYVVLLCHFGSYSGQSEVFFVPLMATAALLLVDQPQRESAWKAFAAMLICGVALQVKYTVLPQCIFLGLWSLYWSYRAGSSPAQIFKRAVSFAGLGLLPTIAVGLFYWASGHFDSWLFANFQSFFERAPSYSGRLNGDVLARLGLLVGLAILGIYAAWRLRRPTNLIAYGFLTCWYLAALGTVFLPGTIYFYYFGSLVPPAVLVLLPFIDRRGMLGPLPGILLVGAFIIILRIPHHAELSKNQTDNAKALASDISPFVDDARCLFVFDGPTSLYRMTGSCLPTRFIYPDHLNNALEKNALGISQEEEVARILAEQPPVIVTSDIPVTVQNDAAGRLVRAAIAAEYQRLGEAEILDRTTRTWVRRDIAQASLHSSRSAHGPDD